MTAKEIRMLTAMRYDLEEIAKALRYGKKQVMGRKITEVIAQHADILKRMTE